MRKLAAILLAFGLYAADPWQSKPFMEWSDKDVNKILTNSPWARAVSVSVGSPTMPGGRGDPSGADETLRRPSGGDLEGPGGGPPGGNVASREPGTRTELAATPSLQLTIRWQSALPVKQALARRKYGSEAATSPDAKNFLEDNSVYLIAVSGLPPAIAGVRSPQAKAAILEQTTLSSKGKDALPPSDILLGPPGKLIEAFFVFPKARAFTLADKEIEFSTKLGPLVVKYKFHLKDMLYNGSLEL